jgi:tRNA (guanine-N7-)-methyltransferase
MKPENLKCPFTWRERKIVINDRVWYVPDYCAVNDEFIFPGWEHPSLFGNSNPICIEYCSGNGAWLTDKAVANPNINWVGVEKKFLRARKIWAKIKNLQLNNLLVICGEGKNVTSCYIPTESIESVYINFPDPWPKFRHAKHRIVQPLFVQELGRILKESGEVTLVTDDPDYSRLMIEHFKKNQTFISQYPAPYFITDEREYGSSYFDQLWREKGKTIHFHRFKKTMCSVA